MVLDYLVYLAKVRRFFESTRQTNWGKTQILAKLLELQAEFLQEALTKQRSEPQA